MLRALCRVRLDTSDLSQNELTTMLAPELFASEHLHTMYVIATFARCDLKSVISLCVRGTSNVSHNRLVGPFPELASPPKYIVAVYVLARTPS